MRTGLEKEFDLSMEEVDSFLTWYENKQAGTGTASYAIDKHDNNKAVQQQKGLRHERITSYSIKYLLLKLINTQLINKQRALGIHSFSSFV